MAWVDFIFILFNKWNTLVSMAGLTRLELATSGVTGQRSNQLNYDPAQFRCSLGRRNRDRTCDPRLVRPVLSQLSYPPQKNPNCFSPGSMGVYKPQNFLSRFLNLKHTKFCFLKFLDWHLQPAGVVRGADPLRLKFIFGIKIE